MLARSFAGGLLGLCALILCGCVTLPPGSPRSPQDPWESWNRGVYRINDKVDRAVAKPIAKGYVKVVPKPLRTGVSNFFANLNTPTVLINDALQGKFLAALNDLGRLVLNSTIGIGGLLDPATSAGLDKNDEDFGQTLGKWGVHSGPFLEIPLLGPSDLRDAPARVVDAYTNPQAYIGRVIIKYPLYGLYLIDTRAGLLSLDDTISHAYDPYAFVRDAYLQRRAYLVSDGKVNEAPLEDPGENTTEPPATNPPAIPPVPPTPPTP
jgi:phospholipid-binding lipoprotein MlaA